MDTPRQIWRAIIWEALNRQSKDDTAAAIIWLTASSLIQHIALDSNERELLMEFLLSLRDKTERRAVAEWEKPQLGKSTLESLRSEFGEINVATAINEAFKQDIIKACGPNDVDDNPINGANPNLPSSNTLTNAGWAEEFAERMARAVGSRIDSSRKGLADTLRTELKAFAEELETLLSELNHSCYAKQKPLINLTDEQVNVGHLHGLPDLFVRASLGDGTRPLARP